MSAHTDPKERFDALYEQSRDPWGYQSSDYEREKYESTLAAIPPVPIHRALEVGCSIGVFTAQLAERCEHVVAVDFSSRAIELARSRLTGVPNVEVRQARFPEQAPAGPWELVVCSELLYYLAADSLTRAIAWLTTQVRDGACVLAVSWRGQGTDEPFLGDEVHDRLARELAPWHSLDARRDGYRLDRFQRR